MRKEIVLDLETKTAPRGWSDREELKNLGVSVVGVWSDEGDYFKAFRESEFKSLETLLKNADRLIGFAVKKFDIPVLQPHIGFDLGEIPVLDMFEDVMNKGPLAREPCVGVQVNLMDMKLHEDSIHSKTRKVFRTNESFSHLFRSCCHSIKSLIRSF